MTAVTFTDGNVLSAADLNNAGLHRKVFSVATENTVTSTTNWTNVGSGSFTISSVGSMIMGIRFVCEAKSSNTSGIMGACLKISGTTLGTTYLASRADDGSGYEHRTMNRGTGTASTLIPRYVATELSLIETNNTAYYEFGSAHFVPLLLPDATTTIQIRFKISNASYTAYIKNMVVEVIYAGNCIDV